MIELVPRDDAERRLWAATLDLAELLDGLPWTLIGAQMVMLHAFEAGVVPGRTTGDLDFLLDVRAYVGATTEATRRLEEAGFQGTGLTPDGVAHRFRRDDVIVDVLVPEGLGHRASRETFGGGRTIEVRGGTQALRRTESVEVALDGRNGNLRRPGLLGAVLLKARAVSAAAGEAAKHRNDFAFLLGLIPDPRLLAEDLTDPERSWLRTRGELNDQTHSAWRAAVRPDDAYLAFQILTARP